MNPEDLSAAEAQLWDAFPLARTVDLRTGGDRERRDRVRQDEFGVTLADADRPELPRGGK